MTELHLLAPCADGLPAWTAALTTLDRPWRLHTHADEALHHLGAPKRGERPAQLVLLAAATGTEPLLDTLLTAWRDVPPCALSLLSAAALPEPAASLWAARGLTGQWPAGLLDEPPALARALALDAAHWSREQALRDELARLREQLDERKWVDRAKGVLMSARGISEDEAFRLLRGASMQANLRVGEVSRSVIEAAQWAEAINRAGQLRMLSQRVVNLAAQGLAGLATRQTRSAQGMATGRLQDNLQHLAAWPPLREAPAETREALTQATQAWTALRAVLAARPTVETLAQADQRAQALLGAAEALTQALQAGGARQALHIINLCGRQRMRVQRLAKEALLSVLLAEPARLDALPPLMDEVEATQLDLERAPLSSAEIRAMLVRSREEWLNLLRGLRAVATPEGRQALAVSSDALLTLFDQLTAAYEHSLQVILA